MAETIQATNESSYDRLSDLKAFVEAKTGVKGLVDAGVTKVPNMFIQPAENMITSKCTKTRTFIIPAIDLNGIDKDDPIRRKEIVEQVRDACKTWGFFHVVNHSIAIDVLEEMKNGGRRFFEQDNEVKKKWYNRDRSKPVGYNSHMNMDGTKPVDWKDILCCRKAPNPPNPDQLPHACRDILMDYSKQVLKLSNCLFELMSEALGLNPNHLKDFGCTEGLSVLCNYYPASPQPELTLGTHKHVDGDIITVLLQDQVGGLQFLHDNQRVDVHPMPGALVINVGDLLQLITNDQFKSMEHRVLTKNVGPRLSVACFLTGMAPYPIIFRPIKELLSDEKPPKYRETTHREYYTRFNASKFDGTDTLLHFKL